MNFWNRSLIAGLVSYFLPLSLVIIALVSALAFIGAREPSGGMTVGRGGTKRNGRSIPFEHLIGGAF